jgi:tagatose 6-phosphate kinase
MITTVTLNTAHDVTYYVDKWEKNGVYRVKRKLSEPGGKGNNVAKVVRVLGGQAVATGFLGKGNGSSITAKLTKRGISTHFISVPGESRVCLNIIDEANNGSTEFLEAGVEVSAKKLEEMKTVVRELAERSAIVVMSGSLPGGVPTGIYYDLIRIVKEAGAKAFLDTSGESLTEGLRAVPDFIKPNEQELSKLLGREFADERDLLQAALDIAGTGISAVCISLGDKGAIAVIDGEAYRVYPPQLQAANTVGCGDAFVAGMAFATESGDSAPERLRKAAAAAAANALTDTAGTIEFERYSELLQQVRVEKLNV